jgi:excinuclease ABC subunit A
MAQRPEQIIQEIARQYKKRETILLAPKVAGRKGYHKDTLSRALAKGYKEARIDGQLVKLKKGMALSRYHEHSIDLVVEKLPGQNLDERVHRALEEGSGALMVLEDNGKETVFSLQGICPSCGIGVQALDPRLFSFNSSHGSCPRCDGIGQLEKQGEWRVCQDCQGSRLRPEATSVKIGGHSIWDLVNQPADRLRDTLKPLAFSAHEQPIVEPILSEITTRLSLLNRLGLSYLALSRSGDTLSGGEAQRVRLAAQLGSNLTGVCYILDEPTIGLHAKDHRMLLNALKELRDRGNTILVVEHDEETIREADEIIDLGPGAGEKGGHIVAQGSLQDLKKVPSSATGMAFGSHHHGITSQLRPYKGKPAITVQGASKHNLKKLNARFPLGTLICVTGVSGSGKSTLLKEILYKEITSRLSRKKPATTWCRDVTGWETITRALEVDHSPIGRTPRSIPASYVGFLDTLRKLFAGTPEARARGYKPGRFSFNVAAGRCEACKGHGSNKVVMSFLPDVYIHCEICNGRRFNRETLAVTYKGKNMAQVLDLTFDEAADFFAPVPAIRKPVQMVCDIGLGYLRLGQPSPTLSGGEAQRIKLARELSKKTNGHTLYILDEPTTGLHLTDVQRLLTVIQALVDEGNTIAAIEHNMEVIKEADYIIDLGPEGGAKGGQVMASGSPKELVKSPGKSYTMQYLKRYVAS